MLLQLGCVESPTRPFKLRKNYKGGKREGSFLPFPPLVCVFRIDFCDSSTFKLGNRGLGASKPIKVIPQYPLSWAFLYRPNKTIHVLQYWPIKTRVKETKKAESNRTTTLLRGPTVKFWEKKICITRILSEDSHFVSLFAHHSDFDKYRGQFKLTIGCYFYTKIIVARPGNKYQEPLSCAFHANAS